MVGLGIQGNLIMNTDPKWLWRRVVAVVVSLAVTSGCAPKTARPQTDIMEQTGKVSVSAAVLRARLNDLVERFARQIELTADRIRAETDDDTLRRQALVLKLDAIPAVYAAGFRTDPLAAVVDLWGFAFQFRQYYDGGAGQNDFGPRQPLVQECARDLLTDADAFVKAIAIRPEYFDQSRARVEGWAKTHPVEHAFSARASGAALVADLRSDDRNVFLDVGTVSDVIKNLSERLEHLCRRNCPSRPVGTPSSCLPRWLTRTTWTAPSETSTRLEQPLAAQPIS
jgi:hypothetical protein